MNSPENSFQQNPATTSSAMGSTANIAGNTTEVRLSDGRVLRMPTALLEQFEGTTSASGVTAGSMSGIAGSSTPGSSFPGSSTAASGVSGPGVSGPQASASAAGYADDSKVIPLIEERLAVGKRVVSTGTVRLRKSVQEFETSLNEPLAVRTFDIERIVLNQPIETAPGVRHEGDTTIYPLVEEQLILTKQLVLKEEVRVTRRDTERIDTQTVTLRREHLEVEREGR